MLRDGRGEVDLRGRTGRAKTLRSFRRELVRMEPRCRDGRKGVWLRWSLLMYGGERRCRARPEQGRGRGCGERELLFDPREIVL